MCPGPEVLGRGKKEVKKNPQCRLKVVGGLQICEGVIIEYFSMPSSFLRFTKEGSSCCQNVFITILKIWDGPFIKYHPTWTPYIVY